MKNSVLAISQLLNTKLCHDIAGLIGAIDNSLDYIDSPDNSIKTQAISLLQNSSKEAVKRLSFYREAYCYGGGEGFLISSIKDLLESFFNPDKISISIKNLSNIDNISKLIFKFSLLLVNLAYTSLPRGGSITLVFNSSGSGEIFLEKLILSGKMITQKAETLNILKGDNCEINSSNIAIYYIFLLLKELKKDVEITTEYEKLIYNFYLNEV